MTFWKQLWRVELVVVVCLLVYAAGLTVLLRIGAVAFASTPPTVEGLGLSFVLILWFGVLPAMVVFAPTYALLRAKGMVNFPIAVVVGLISGAVLVAVARMGAIALYALPSSVIVAMGVHAVMRRAR